MALCQMVMRGAFTRDCPSTKLSNCDRHCAALVMLIIKMQNVMVCEEFLFSCCGNEESPGSLSGVIILIYSPSDAISSCSIQSD